MYTQDTSRCGLLSLPVELRLDIYSYLDLGVVKAEGFIGASENGNGTNTDKFKTDVQRYRRSKYQLVCRQFDKELLREFYVRNGFEFFNMSQLCEFMEAIGFVSRKYLTRLRIHYTSSNVPQDGSQAAHRAYRALRYLLSCKTLRCLEINVRYKPDGYDGCWLSFPVKNPSEALSRESKVYPVEFAAAELCGKARRLANYNEEETAEDKVQIAQLQQVLREALQKVKAEAVKGVPGSKSRKLPNVHAGEARPWKGVPPHKKGTSYKRQIRMSPSPYDITPEQLRNDSYLLGQADLQMQGICNYSHQTGVQNNNNNDNNNTFTGPSYKDDIKDLYYGKGCENVSYYYQHNETNNDLESGSHCALHGTLFCLDCMPADNSFTTVSPPRSSQPRLFSAAQRPYSDASPDATHWCHAHGTYVEISCPDCRRRVLRTNAHFQQAIPRTRFPQPMTLSTPEYAQVQARDRMSEQAFVAQVQGGLSQQGHQGFEPMPDESDDDLDDFIDYTGGQGFGS